MRRRRDARVTIAAGPGRRRAGWHLAVIVVATFLVYANAFGNAFLWDDIHLIVDNPAIKSWARFPSLWVSDLFPQGVRSYYYRPVQAVTYLVDYQLWGLSPLGYHLTSTLVHGVVALLLYHLASLVLAVPAAALITALLFTIHPIHTEAVTYLSGRSDPLSALFVLASLIWFLRGERTRLTLWRWLSLGAFAAALLAREVATVGILLIVLVDVAVDVRDGQPLRQEWRRRAVRYLPYVGVLLGYLTLRTAVVGLPPTPAATAQVPLLLRMLTMVKVVLHYLAVLLIPIDQHMERLVAPARSLAEPAVLGAAAVVGGLIAGAIVCARTSWPVAFGVAWFFAALLPVANLVPLATFMAEHWLYVPSMGLFLIAGWTFHRLLARGWRGVATLGLGVALVAYAGLTIRRNTDWKDGVTLYQATLVHAPHSARVHSNLGQVYQDAGQLAQAEAAYRQALRLDPGATDAHNNLGNIYRRQRRHDDALREFTAALAINPGHAPAQNNLGLLLLETGRPEEARGAFEAALRFAPDYSAAHSNLGNYHFHRGQWPQARDHYRAAISLKPDFAEAYNNLGSAYFKLGDLDQAEAAYRAALRLAPHLDEVRRNLDVVLGARGKAPGAGSRGTLR